MQKKNQDIKNCEKNYLDINSIFSRLYIESLAVLTTIKINFFFKRSNYSLRSICINLLNQDKLYLNFLPSIVFTIQKIYASII